MGDEMDEKDMSSEGDSMGDADAFDTMIEDTERSISTSQPSYGECV